MKPQDLVKTSRKRKRQSGIDSTEETSAKKQKHVKVHPEEVKSKNYAAQFADELSLLKSEDKITNTRLQEVYDSITSKLLRLGADMNAQLTAADVTRTVLTSHDGRQLFKLLSHTSTAGQCQAALRLLTACVTSGSSAARAVLAEFRFDHTRLPQIAAVKNLTASTDNRVAFVNFVLAFLIGRDRLLIQALMEKIAPLMIVMNGLSTDRAETVHLVLSTWKQAFLQNPKISKREKIRLFNARNMGPVLELYRWRGHRHSWRPRTNKYKKKTKRPQEEDEPNPADPDELQQVRQNVHEFCLVLFTSHQHGIAFRDASMGTSGTNHNPVLLELLKMMSAPWRDQLATELVAATLAACPDLHHMYFSHLAAVLRPRLSAEWRAVVAMVTAVMARTALPFSDATEGVVERGSMSVEGMCQAIAGCFYPAAVSEAIKEGVSHEATSVRRTTLGLLATIVQQLRDLQSSVQSLAQYGPTYSSALGFDALPHLPPCETILKMWKGLFAAGIHKNVKTAQEEDNSDEEGSKSNGRVNVELGNEELTGEDGEIENERRMEYLEHLLRVIAGCFLLTPSWCIDAAAISGLKSQLELLALPPDLHQSLLTIIKPLTDQTQMLSGNRAQTELRLDDVPRILAQLSGDAPPTDGPDESATGSDDDAESTDRAVRNEGSMRHRQKSVETSPSEDASMKEETVKKLITLKGESVEEVVTSFVAVAKLLMKEDEPDEEGLSDISTQLISALENMDQNDTSYSGAIPGLVEYVKQSLKRGMRNPNLGCIVIPTLTKLVKLNIIRCNGGVDATADATITGTMSCELLYEMTLSHSAFLEHMLDPGDEGLRLRDSILEMLLVVVDRCSHVCKTSHVALFLAAYGASLARTDQLLLQLVSKYEAAGLALDTYQPMVWGSAALHFYNPTQGGGLSLRSRPTCETVVALLDADKMAATCQLLPLKMTLQVTPLSENADIYDPRFLLSMLYQLLAPEQQAKPLALIDKGVVALLVCLLSCRNAAVKEASWTVLGRLHLQLEASRNSRLKLVWLTFVDLLRSSAALSARLPFSVALSWARLTAILQQPAHKLFRLVSRYLLQCASNGKLELERIPLFFQLFNSRQALEHKAEQAWMCSHLAQSVRQMSDYGVLHRTITYKLLMSAASSSLDCTRHLFLKILESTVRLPYALLDLEYRHGLLTWLTSFSTSRFVASESATRAALVALAKQTVDTLEQYLSTSEQRDKLGVFFENLESFLAVLERVVEEDSALRPKVMQCRTQVDKLKVV